MWSFLVLALSAVDPKVLVRPDTSVAAVQISGLTLSQTSVMGGATVNGTVSLAGAAGPNGTLVKFQSSNPAIVTVPPSVVVQSGATSANFLVQSNPYAQNPDVVTDPASANISAQGGTSTRSVKLTVLAPTLASFGFNPASVTGGTAGAGQVTITGPAPSGGLAIALALAKPDPAKGVRGLATPMAGLQQPSVTVPLQVVVPAGATSASFSVATKAVSTSTPVAITASYGVFNSKTATLTILGPAVGSISLSPTTDPVGPATLNGSITLTSPAGSAGFGVAISVSDTGTYGTCGPPPSAPATVQIPAGATTVSFAVAISPGTGRYKLIAGGASVTLFEREALINGDSLVLPGSVKGGTTVQAKLQLIGTASNCGFGGHYKLRSGATNLAQVPNEVVVPIGSSVGMFSITTTAVPNNQSVDIFVMGNVGYGFAEMKKTLTLTP